LFFGTRAFLSALSLTIFAASGCVRLPELGNLSYLAPRERRGSVLASIDPAHPKLALNELQLKGSHNSYHRAPRLALSRTWRYSHSPLEVQLGSQGVRQLELDVRYTGGDLRVNHLPMVDGRSSCSLLSDCLGRIKRWSREHPAHLPVFVFIEVKEDLAPSSLEGKLDSIDFAITRQFSRDMLLMPEDVAGSSPSLREAIVEHGWPSIDDTRGRIAFVMFGPKRHKVAYTKGRPRLDHRVMFVAERETTHAHASVIFYDDPLTMRSEIAAAVKQRFLVRTRADEKLHRSTRRRDAALSSGANFSSSDYVDPRHNWIEFSATSAARCNPLSASADCTSLALSENVRPALAEAVTPSAKKPVIR
jgi:hypothetical protein